MIPTDTQIALHVLKKAFISHAPKRLINGCLISSPRRNANGNSFDSETFLWPDLPIVLLRSHDWTRPIGLVRDIRVDGARLLFDAEIANGDSLSWASEAWRDVLCHSLTGVSIGAAQTSSRKHFTACEASLVDRGADNGARILRVTERQQYITLDGTPRERIHWRSDFSAKPGVKIQASPDRFGHRDGHRANETLCPSTSPTKEETLDELRRQLDRKFGYLTRDMSHLLKGIH